MKKPSQESKTERIIIFIKKDSRNNHRIDQLRIWVKVNDYAARLFIDSDCIENYIFPNFARKIRISIKNKKKSYSLRNFNDFFIKYNSELINQKIWFIYLRIERHWRKLSLDVTKQSGSDIVLRISWLRSINSMINWVNDTIIFIKQEIIKLHSILQSLQNVKIFVMTSKEMRSVYQKDIENAQMLWSREIQRDHFKDSVIVSIFKEYKEYQILFKQESDQETLFKH